MLHPAATHERILEERDRELRGNCQTIRHVLVFLGLPVENPKMQGLQRHPVGKRFRDHTHARHQLLRGWRGDGDVAQLAARALGLTVKMKVCFRDRQDGGRIRMGANDIDHGAGADRICRPHRQAGDSAHMVLELGTNSAFNTPVP